MDDKVIYDACSAGNDDDQKQNIYSYQYEVNEILERKVFHDLTYEFLGTVRRAVVMDFLNFRHIMIIKISIYANEANVDEQRQKPKKK